MIYFTANTRNAKAYSDDAITVDSRGIPLHIELSDDFAGLQKTFCFKAGDTAVDVVWIGDDLSIDTVLPSEMCEEPGSIKMGCWAANGEGTIVIPTVWASVRSPVQGVTPSGIDPSEPTPSWAAQVQDIAGRSLENSNEALLAAADAKEAAIDAQDSAKNSATAASRAAQSASENAEIAANSAVQAVASARNAHTYMNRAEQAAHSNGYMEFRIVEGHLIYERTNAVDTDFYLNAEGHLVMKNIAV